MLCECGCGSETEIVKFTSNRRGVVKGEPRRFLPGHNSRLRNEFHPAEYHAFYSARRRCINPKDGAYARYGGRGIEFRFHHFSEFFAHLGSKPTPKHTLDRINNEGHYEVGNVRWATWSENLLNRRRCKRKRGYKLSPEHARKIGEGHRGLKYRRH
jgi:hypothetical protein